MKTPRLAPATPAAGGVVWRATDSELELALIHRPRYDDWSLPKGKLDAGEYPLRAAVREVSEETGSAVAVGRRLVTVTYPLTELAKRVSYWSMRHRYGEHLPSEEVDTVRWLEPQAAGELLSYDADRQVLSDFIRLPPETAMILLVRHGKAGKRSDFKGDDRLRPLDKIGRRQARDLVAVLDCFAPQRVVTADRLRCEQTIRPLADSLGLSVRIAPEVSDEAFGEDPDNAIKLVRSLAAEGGTSVVCSQGDAIPGLLAGLGAQTGKPVQCRKGSVWALSMVSDAVVAADYYARPTG
ncbi:MAG: 8-oxo-(d)GTP phosphatase [Pseudonocardiales bacterium]|jgi:8-oxo-dGTP diphosphatase|nr:8-oxo-(d)GTP phosphatase [Pseudonocardiales bacterium]